MNTQNVGSLEACKRLADSGIVLETDFVWRLGVDGWKLLTKDWVRDMMSNTYESIPAPSMADVWRELPEQYEGEYLQIFKDGDRTFCGRSRYGEYADRLSSKNPTDALINLLIWCKAEASHD